MKTGADDFLLQAGPEALQQLCEAAEKTVILRGEADHRIPQSGVIIQLADGVDLWHTPEGEAYATILKDDHHEHWPVRSKTLRGWLNREFYRKNRKPPGSQALQDAIGLLEARAAQEGPEHPVFLRLAGQSDKVFLDLCNSEWEAVEITPSGWRIVKDPQVYFRRTRGMLPLPNPVGGGGLEELHPFVNIREGPDRQLYIAWLVGALRPSGPYPVLIFEGEQGSAKSTTEKVTRSLLDPSVTPLRTLPREERDLMIAANNGWVIAFDNLSGLPMWMSDALARLATGGGLSTRELYTDKEETLFDAQRPIVLNGIDQISNRGDLLDRAIRLVLPPIPEDQRKEESKFWQEFEMARPRILGALLTAVSTALKRIPEVHLERLPRMADFAKWVAAAESAFGWQEGVFMEAYNGNRKESMAIGLENDMVANALIDMIGQETGQSWLGTATELLHTLGTVADEASQRSKSWPKSPGALSNRLSRAAPLLKAQGVEIVKGDGNRQPGTGRRLISIRKVQETTVTDCHNVTNPVHTEPSMGDASEAGMAGNVTASSQPNGNPSKSCDDVTRCDTETTDVSDHEAFLKEAAEVFTP